MTMQVINGILLVHGQKIRRFKRWLVLAIGVLVMLWLASITLSPWYRLGINGTDSLPGVLYLVLKEQYPETPGDLFAFHPPKNRFYRDSMFFIKKTIGMPGDEVTREDDRFYINGEYVGTAKHHSSTGELLMPGPVGVIPDGHYFVWTPHPDSYDSRYEDISWISKDRIIGRAFRLL